MSTHSLPRYRRFATLREKLLAFTDRRGPDECWAWLGNSIIPGRQHQGKAWKDSRYGRCRFKGSEPLYAHRLTYEEFVAPIPVGYSIDHTCFNGLCQNPAHLEAVPQQENSRRYAVQRLIPLRKEQAKRRYDAILRLREEGLSHRAIAARMCTYRSAIWRALKVGASL